MTTSDRVQRLVAAASWALIALIGGVVLTQVVGYSGFRLLATVQTLTPYVLLIIGPIAALASLQQRHVMAVTASAIGVGVLVLALPLVRPPLLTPSADGSTGVRVAAVNLLYRNDRTAEIADDLVDRAPDVIVFTEYTPRHREQLEQHRLAERYPHRLDRDGELASGVAVWSRHRLVPVRAAGSLEPSIDARVDGPDGAFRLLAVHPPTPVYDFDGWERALDVLRREISQDAQPTLVIGDFNASYWHPPFRDLLGAGFTDAHIATGRGWSMSWPTDAIVPPYVRLDHALTGHGLTATDVDDFRVAGSDHAAFVVTVAPSRPAEP